MHQSGQEIIELQGYQLCAAYICALLIQHLDQK